MKLNLLATAPTFAPSRKQVSRAMRPASASTATTSAKTSSKTERARSVRNPLTVEWPSGSMPVSCMGLMFSRVAAAIFLLEQMPPAQRNRTT